MNDKQWKERYPNFSKSELACKCGECEYVKEPKISYTFLDKVQKARSVSPIPYKVTSGCRCWTHNKNEGGAEKSNHLCTEVVSTNALDITYKNGWELFAIIRDLMDAGIKYFRINQKQKFVHFDNRGSMVIGFYK